MDDLTKAKIRYGVTEPDDAKARALILAILVQQWLDGRKAAPTQTELPLVKAA